MRPHRPASLFLSLAALSLPGCTRQTATANPWVGEWGHYEQDHTYAYRTFYGQGLSITNCTAQGCALSIATHNKEANGSADGSLQLQSPTQAVAHLGFQGQEHCTLVLTRDPSHPAIQVSNGTGDCSYFLTPGGSFLGSYTLHSHNVFVAEDVPACFATTAPAHLALCTHKPLADEESQWERLFLTVADLTENSGPAGTLKLQTAQDTFTTHCNSAPDPAGCLHSAFAQSTAALNKQQAAWTATVNAPGDPGQAAQAASAIAGHYRHRFANGDVQGDNFTSTDKLDIQVLTGNAIHYSVQLNFYNGHECSLEGTAAYKQIGFFIDQKKADTPDSPRCIFEIIPRKDGVRLEDPTGGCKTISCGMRGGYHGADFPFTERR